MTPALLTIGYEGAPLEAVLAALGEAGVRTVIDVRDAPVSRKAGFSKAPLRAAVEEAGMAYVHLRALGTPKAGRDAARAGDRARFRRIFEAQLETPAAVQALGVAALLARREGPVCLLCFEREPERCHRTIVAERLSRRLGVAVAHLQAVPRLL